jgi:hypothetical protein
MAIPLSSEIRALLDGPNCAHLATLLADGSPQSVPVWVSREGDRILICTGEGSLKAKNIRRDPRVARTLYRRFPRPISGGRAKRSCIGYREDSLQPLDSSNALFSVHRSQYLTEPRGGQTAPGIPMTDQHALPYS